MLLNVKITAMFLPLFCVLLICSQSLLLFSQASFCFSLIIFVFLHLLNYIADINLILLKEFVHFSLLYTLLTHHSLQVVFLSCPCGYGALTMCFPKVQAGQRRLFLGDNISQPLSVPSSFDMNGFKWNLNHGWVILLLLFTFKANIRHIFFFFSQADLTKL